MKVSIIAFKSKNISLLKISIRCYIILEDTFRTGREQSNLLFKNMLHRTWYHVKINVLLNVK